MNATPAASRTATVPSVIEVDLVHSRRGLRSTLAETVGDRTVLARTVAAVERCRSVDKPVLMVHSRDATAARAAFPEFADDRWFVHEYEDIPARERLRRARLWGKEGWRGGIGDAYFFCEAGNPRALRDLCHARRWDDFVLVPAEAAFLDPAQLDTIVAHYLAERQGAPVYLSTAPPGIAADVVGRGLVEALSDASASIDRVYPFQLDSPRSGADENRIYHHFDEAITTARGRYTVDSADALARARAIAESGDEPSSCHELWARFEASDLLLAGAFPEEIVVELTSDHDGAWTPRGSSDAAPNPIDPRVWQAVLEAASSTEELLVTLGGGYADPLLDRCLEKRIRELRESGALGIHVETCGSHLDENRANALIAAHPDAITVDLTATRTELLPTLRPQTPPYEARVRGLERLLAARDRVDGPCPFVMVSVLFEESGADGLDAFMDRWFGPTDRVLIRGIEGAQGEEVDGSLGCFAPPARFACHRIERQLRVEHDGTVPLCSRDPGAAFPVGDLRDASVASVWRCDRFGHARQCHRSDAWAELPHCDDCRSWFRFD
ncbi:MAG: SPASM domain-containing protein [Planctomycetota bacterium]